MKNPLVAIILLIVLAGVSFGGFIFLRNSTTPKSVMENTRTSPESATMENADTSIRTNSPRYIEYATGVLDSVSNSRRVLFFYANWCPTCRPADDNFRNNTDTIPEDVTVIRVNYNDTETDQEEKDIAGKYGITYQHTFVQIDNAGDVITKWNGGQINELRENIK